MRVGIISDTHDQLAVTRHAVRLLQHERAEVLVHCGDLTGPEIVQICAVLPCFFALGNHDADRAPELEHAISQMDGTCLGDGGVIKLGGKRVAVVHGHIGMRDMAARRPDYLLHGHSHIPADADLDGVRRICPGALHRADRLSAALLEIDSGDLQFLNLTG